MIYSLSTKLLNGRIKYGEVNTGLITVYDDEQQHNYNRHYHNYKLNHNKYYLSYNHIIHKNTNFCINLV